MKPHGIARRGPERELKNDSAAGRYLLVLKARYAHHVLPAKEVRRIVDESMDASGAASLTELLYKSRNDA